MTSAASYLAVNARWLQDFAWIPSQAHDICSPNKASRSKADSEDGTAGTLIRRSSQYKHDRTRQHPSDCLPTVSKAASNHPSLLAFHPNPRRTSLSTIWCSTIHFLTTVLSHPIMNTFSRAWRLNEYKYPAMQSFVCVES